jgi:hypothetical protein
MGTWISATAEMRVNRGLPLGLHHPLKAHRMALGHIGALDDDAVRVRQVLLECGGARSSERDPQTGDRGGVSNTGLIFHLDNAQGRGQLLDQVVLFHIQRGAPRCAIPSVRRRGWPSLSCYSQVDSRVRLTRSATISMARSRGTVCHSLPQAGMCPMSRPLLGRFRPLARSGCTADAARMRETAAGRPCDRIHQLVEPHSAITPNVTKLQSRHHEK